MAAIDNAKKRLLCKKLDTMDPSIVSLERMRFVGGETFDLKNLLTACCRRIFLAEKKSSYKRDQNSNACRQRTMMANGDNNGTAERFENE